MIPQKRSETVSTSDGSRLVLERLSTETGYSGPFSMRHADIFRNRRGIGKAAGLVFGPLKAWSADHPALGISSGELANGLGPSKRTVRTHLRRLASREMVRKVVDGSDRWIVCGDEFSAAAACGLQKATEEQHRKHARERERYRIASILNRTVPGHPVIELCGMRIDAATGEVLVDEDGSFPSVHNAAPSSMPDQIDIGVDPAGNLRDGDINMLERFLLHLGGRITTDADGKQVIVAPERKDT
jgi:hypothetical protein